MNWDTSAARNRRVLQVDSEFYCKFRRKNLEVGKCLDDYLDANALGRRRSACFRCTQGKNVRMEFADADSD